VRTSIPAGLSHKEAELYSRLDPARLPRHIAIIMDGNGRWAKRRHLPRIAGHRSGVFAVRNTVQCASRIGLPAMTLYAFSVENWLRRPKTETSFLMGLLRRYLKIEMSSFQENNVRVQFIGRWRELPIEVQERMDWAIAETANNTGLTLTFAINYGGRSEIVDAFKSAINAARRNGGLNHFEINEEVIDQHLYTSQLPELDLLIRTSGEMRLSNFLLWQAAYSEIYVTETLWPDFSGVKLLEAIAEFQKRERRFGGIESIHPATVHTA
jgi:undecaprenyl diphosphate synthase